MLSRTLKLWLMIGLITPFVASADQVIPDDLIVFGASDGTAPAYNCSAGLTLPFTLPDFSVDSSSAIGTIPAGDPLIVPELIFSTCDFSSEPFICEYTCKTVGGLCVGQDCSNIEPFADDEVILKENNLRIRLDNTSIDPTLLGRSWNLKANAKRNGGASYFDFQVKSLEADTVHLVTVKDGEQPSYDCSLPANPFSTGSPFDILKVGIIPVGEPLVAPQFVGSPGAPSNCTGTFPNQLCEVECVDVLDYEEKSLLTLGPAGAGTALGDGVAVGYESSVESGVVSVGRADLVRRIAHIAAGIELTDALSLANFDLLGQQLIDVNAQLDAIEAEIVILEENPTIETTIPTVLSEIDTLLIDPGVSDKAKKDLDKARKRLERAQRDLEKGHVKKAIKRIARAVTKLLQAEKQGADVADLINLLVGSSRVEAQNAIDAAIAANGKPKDIQRAQHELTKAQKDLGKGKPDKAIDHYSHALDKAQKAVK